MAAKHNRNRSNRKMMKKRTQKKQNQAKSNRSNRKMMKKRTQKKQNQAKSNRNNRKMMKKRTQKKQNQAKRKQPKKQKKRQARKAGSKTVLSISSPRMFAAKILRHLPKVRMETKARGLMKTLMMDVYGHISKEMESRNQNNEQPTVNPSSVQAILKEAMVKELAKHTAEPTST